MNFHSVQRDCTKFLPGLAKGLPYPRQVAALAALITLRRGVWGLLLRSADFLPIAEGSDEANLGSGSGSGIRARPFVGLSAVL